MKLLFERSRPGRGNDLLPPCDVPVTQFDPSLLRGAPLRLPEIAEVDLGRHYTELAKQTHGVNDGFYPLGSCTMKYNPRVNEEAAAQPGFTQLHPLQPVETVQGALEVLATAERLLCEITGMDGMSFQPAAGAHGEYTGLLLIRKYHQSRGDAARTKILVPDAAHGTNPASATMAGFQVVSIPSNQAGGVDLDALRQAVGPDTAGLMLTNPNTVGLFDANILEITQIVHDAGGLCYYDGANLNAVMGQVRPGDMGFDCVHLNLHKTFSTPHGGGGPGSGPVGCKTMLEPFGYTFQEADNFTLQKILEDAGTKPEAPIISTMVLRSLMKARYDTQNLGHFGLAAKYYCHFTSPIRRYPDLMVHRILSRVIEDGERQGKAPWEKRMAVMAQKAAVQSSEREIAAQNAEREIEKLYMAEYMSGHIGEELTGAVSGVTKFGLFIMLPSGVEGLLPAEALPGDKWHYDEKRMTLRGEHTGRVFSFGMALEVVCVQADPGSGQIDFRLAGEGELPVIAPREKRHELPIAPDFVRGKPRTKAGGRRARPPRHKAGRGGGRKR